MFNGTFVVMAIVLLVNFKIMVNQYEHTWISHFWIWGSMLWFYAFFGAESMGYLPSELQGMLPLMMTFTSTYLLLILMIAGFLLVDHGMLLLENWYDSKIEMQDRI